MKSLEEFKKLLEDPDATACYVWVIMYGRSLLEYIDKLEYELSILESNHSC